MENKYFAKAMIEKFKNSTFSDQECERLKSITIERIEEIIDFRIKYTLPKVNFFQRRQLIKKKADELSFLKTLLDVVKSPLLDGETMAVLSYSLFADESYSLRIIIGRVKLLQSGMIAQRSYSSDEQIVCDAVYDSIIVLNNYFNL